MLPLFLFGFLTVSLGSYYLTSYVHRYLLKNAILDTPNERSSHRVPTPRGGGLAIVVSFLFAIACSFLGGLIEFNLAISVIGGGLLIAIIGYLDDVYTLNAKIRLLVHLVAAVWALYWLNGIPLLDNFFTTIPRGWISYGIGVIGVVWCINFYNFMDGIDGLACGEGIFVSIAASIALFTVGAYQISFSFILLTAAISGFIFWNWPPAKIFLGDIGSGFLGYTLSILAIYTINAKNLSLAFWWIIMAVFICDATSTLIYRIIQGKKWYSAHREHAYQKLVLSGDTHLQVTMKALGVNYLFLLPIAFAALHWPAFSLWYVVGTTFCVEAVWAFIIFKRPVALPLSNF